MELAVLDKDYEDELENEEYVKNHRAARIIVNLLAPHIDKKKKQPKIEDFIPKPVSNKKQRPAEMIESMKALGFRKIT